MLKKIFIKLFPELALRLRAYNGLIKNKSSYLYRTGWMESYRKGYPVNKQGEPVPWMNYPFVEFIRKRLTKEMSVFEYGCGYSTMFYAKYVNHITSVESDREWYEKIKAEIPSNSTLIYQEKDEDGKYCRIINTTEKKYDIIIIDGKDRNNCAVQALGNLKGKGIIVFDDSHFPKLKEGIEYLEKIFNKKIEFEGLKPTGKGIDKTTIFYNSNNCLNI